MQLYPEAHILYGDYAHDLWKPELVMDVLSKMTPANMRVDLLSHHFDRTASGNHSNLNPKGPGGPNEASCLFVHFEPVIGELSFVRLFVFWQHMQLCVLH